MPGKGGPNQRLPKGQAQLKKISRLPARAKHIRLRQVNRQPTSEAGVRARAHPLLPVWLSWP